MEQNIQRGNIIEFRDEIGKLFIVLSTIKYPDGKTEISYRRINCSGNADLNEIEKIRKTYLTGSLLNNSVRIISITQKTGLKVGSILVNHNNDSRHVVTKIGPVEPKIETVVVGNKNNTKLRNSLDVIEKFAIYNTEHQNDNKPVLYGWYKYKETESSPSMVVYNITNAKVYYYSIYHELYGEMSLISFNECFDYINMKLEIGDRARNKDTNITRTIIDVKQVNITLDEHIIISLKTLLKQYTFIKSLNNTNNETTRKITTKQRETERSKAITYSSSRQIASSIRLVGDPKKGRGTNRKIGSIKIQRTSITI